MSAAQCSEQGLYDALMFGEINVYETPLTVHEWAANFINSLHLLPPLLGFHCSLLAMSPTLAETKHREKDRHCNSPITTGQTFKAGDTDCLLQRKAWYCHCAGH